MTGQERMFPQSTDNKSGPIYRIVPNSEVFSANEGIRIDSIEDSHWIHEIKE